MDIFQQLTEAGIEVEAPETKKVILKYSLMQVVGKGEDLVEVVLPAGSILRHVGIDPKHGPVAWYEVNPSNDTEVKRFRWIKTGETFPTKALEYRATLTSMVVSIKGPKFIVSHLYEVLNG